jgi:hypothetical protein
MVVGTFSGWGAAPIGSLLVSGGFKLDDSKVYDAHHQRFFLICPRMIEGFS